MRYRYQLLCAALFTLHVSLFTSCTQDAYDKGEGRYSLMRADFVEAHADGQRRLDYILTDEGDRLPLKEAMTADWVTTGDTTYRCILYYNKVAVDGVGYVAEPLSIGQVPCPRITPLEELLAEREMKTDPVKFESIWLSRSGKYLNLSLYLLTGTADDEAASHRLTFVCDSVITHPDSTRTASIRLYHDQGGIPEYYSVQVYVSLLTEKIDADSVRVSINTYQEPVVKTLPIAKATLNSNTAR